MDRKGYISGIWLWIIVVIAFTSCKTDQYTEGFAITLRLPNEPDALNPIPSRSTHAAQIESLILLPITEYDPVTLELSPLLISELPAIKSRSGEGARVTYEMNFRPEATWSDGKPVTGEDYLFSLKCPYNKYVNGESWKNFLDFIHDAGFDPDDPRKVWVSIDSNHLQVLDVLTNWNLYPAHIYDPGKVMQNFTLSTLRDANHVYPPDQDSLLRQFATEFESPKFMRESITGSGAYELDQWATGEFIRLRRVENWWADALKDPPSLLKAFPQEITYRIIIDAAAAEAALKAGDIDLMAEVPAQSFLQLKNDPQWQDKLQFATPSLLQVYYLELNTRDSILSDPRIRKALALSIDYDGMMQQVVPGGLAQRAFGPLHPAQYGYHESIEPLKQDLKQAIELIQSAGWSDTNGNGIPDKIVDGQRRELEIHFKTTNKQEGQTIANIIKENAARAGIRIIIDIVESNQFHQDVRQYNFQIVPLRLGAFSNRYNPHSLWHSENNEPGGTHRSGFHTPELDEIIEGVQSTTDANERNNLLYRFQEILYAEQPNIFLYIPLERIIASKRIELITSSRRPGYFENLIRPSNES